MKPTKIQAYIMAEVSVYFLPSPLISAEITSNTDFQDKTLPT